MKITEASLSIEPADDGSPYFLVEVDYAIDSQGVALTDNERVVITLQAAGAGDPADHGTIQPLDLVLADVPIAPDGTEPIRGAVQRRIHRQVLDVDQDWWMSAEDGEPIPIAEFKDRLIAQVEVRRSMTVSAARTNVFIGSFGPLASR